MTHVINLAVKIKTSFTFDKDNIPPSAAIMIEKNGARLAMKKHIHLQSESIKKDDGGLAIQHLVKFPFCDMGFKIKDKSYTVQLMGFKAKYFKMPYFLTDLLIAPLATLEKASHDSSQAMSLLHEATTSKFYADAVFLTTQMPGKKAYSALFKKYPFGARKEYYKEAIILAKKAVSNASRSARWVGYGIAAAISAVLYGAYFIGPLRNIVVQNFTANPALGVIADGVCLTIGVGFGCLATYKMARRPIDAILTKIKGSMAQNGKAKKVKINLLPAMGLSAGIFILIAFASVLVFKQSIMWLPL